MGGNLTGRQKWWRAAIGLSLAVSTADMIGATLHRSAASEFPPVAFGALVGFAAGLVAFPFNARLLRSDRWMGRPRSFDVVGYVVRFAVMIYGFQWLWAHNPGHANELLLGFADGIAIAFVIFEARRTAPPPGDSLPA